MPSSRSHQNSPSRGPCQPIPQTQLLQSKRIGHAWHTPGHKRFDRCGGRWHYSRFEIFWRENCLGCACCIEIKPSGAVILGKTNTHEIALGVTGVNPHFGPVTVHGILLTSLVAPPAGRQRRLHQGCAWACLARIRVAPFAFRPHCAVWLAQPTDGRGSNHNGVIPLSWNLDHVGPLTCTVRDAALMSSGLAGLICMIPPRWTPP